MAQADQTIANATFPSVRADINDNLAALFSNNLGASSPSTTTGGMWWLDTTNNCLKIRSEDNNNWYALSKTDGTQLFGSGTTAALPAFSKYDDVNTGMFFPAADTVAIATNGSEALRIDDSGNVHIGGTAESQSDSFSFMANGTGGTYLNFNMDGRTSAVTGESGCYIFSGSGSSGDFPAGTLVLQSRSNLNRDIAFVTGSSPSIKLKIDGASGNVGIGSIPATNTRFVVKDTSISAGQTMIGAWHNVQNQNAGTGISDCIIMNSSIMNTSNSAIGFQYYNNAFYTGNLEVGFHSRMHYCKLNRNTYHMICEDINYGNTLANGSALFMIYGDGDVVNKDNSYGSVSDIKLKTDIIDASSQWDDILALKIRKYKFKSDVEIETEEEDYVAIQQIGVIAQELEEAGMNGLVTEVNGTKSVKYSVLYMKAIGALQESMNRVQTLETDLEAIKNRLEALEA